METNILKRRNGIRMKVVFLNEDGTKPNVKERFKQKVREAKEWASANKEVLIIMTPLVIGSVTTITKVTGKHINLRKEEALKNLYCYDRSLGHYWKLKRKLSNKEWLEIDARKNKGESLSSILASFKVLK